MVAGRCVNNTKTEERTWRQSRTAEGIADYKRMKKAAKCCAATKNTDIFE